MCVCVSLSALVSLVVEGPAANRVVLEECALVDTLSAVGGNVKKVGVVDLAVHLHQVALRLQFAGGARDGLTLAVQPALALDLALRHVHHELLIPDEEGEEADDEQPGLVKVLPEHVQQAREHDIALRIIHHAALALPAQPLRLLVVVLRVARAGAVRRGQSSNTAAEHRRKPKRRAEVYPGGGELMRRD